MEKLKNERKKKFIFNFILFADATFSKLALHKNRHKYSSERKTFNPLHFIYFIYISRKLIHVSYQCESAAIHSQIHRAKFQTLRLVSMQVHGSGYYHKKKKLKKIQKNIALVVNSHYGSCMDKGINYSRELLAEPSRDAQRACEAAHTKSNVASLYFTEYIVYQQQVQPPTPNAPIQKPTTLHFPLVYTHTQTLHIDE